MITCTTGFSARRRVVLDGLRSPSAGFLRAEKPVVQGAKIFVFVPGELDFFHPGGGAGVERGDHVVVQRLAVRLHQVLGEAVAASSLAGRANLLPHFLFTGRPALFFHTGQPTQ